MLLHIVLCRQVLVNALFSINTITYCIYLYVVYMLGLLCILVQ